MAGLSSQAFGHYDKVLLDAMWMWGSNADGCEEALRRMIIDAQSPSQLAEAANKPISAAESKHMRQRARASRSCADQDYEGIDWDFALAHPRIFRMCPRELVDSPDSGVLPSPAPTSPDSNEEEVPNSESSGDLTDPDGPWRKSGFPDGSSTDYWGICEYHGKEMFPSGCQACLSYRNIVKARRTQLGAN